MVNTINEFQERNKQLLEENENLKQLADKEENLKLKSGMLLVSLLMKRVKLACMLLLGQDDTKN